MAKYSPEIERLLAIGRTRDAALKRYAKRKEAGKTDPKHVAAIGHKLKAKDEDGKPKAKRVGKGTAARKGRKTLKTTRAKAAPAGVSLD